MTSKKKRFAYSLKIASIHLIASLVVALLAAALVWLGWYPWPFNEILKISGLYQLIIIVDVICGPLLTFILANPTKSTRETVVDISLIAAIQIGALIYGLYSLYLVRPVATVFEVDRFVVLSANEVVGFKKLPLLGIEKHALKEPEDGDEKLAMLDFAFTGRSTASNTEWWVGFSSATRQKILSRAKNLDQLKVSKPEYEDALKKLSHKHNTPLDQLLYLPLVTSNNFNWIQIFNTKAETLDHVEINGF